MCTLRLKIRSKVVSYSVWSNLAQNLTLRKIGHVGLLWLWLTRKGETSNNNNNNEMLFVTTFSNIYPYFLPRIYMMDDVEIYCVWLLFLILLMWSFDDRTTYIEWSILLVQFKFHMLVDFIWKRNDYSYNLIKFPIYYTYKLCDMLR